MSRGKTSCTHGKVGREVTGIENGKEGKETPKRMIQGKSNLCQGHFPLTFPPKEAVEGFCAPLEAKLAILQELITPEWSPWHPRGRIGSCLCLLAGSPPN